MKELVLFHIGRQEVNAMELVSVLVVLLLALFLNKLFVRFISRYVKKSRFPDRFFRFIILGIRILIWSVAFIAVLEIVDADYRQVLRFDLYSTKKFTVRVYNFFIIFGIVYCTRILVYLLEHLMNLRISRRKMDRGRGKSFIQILKYFIWSVAIIIICGSMGFEMTFVIASVSALLVGVGFGLQHIFNDFFSGIIILFDGSIKVDDVVEVEGVVGRVLEIGLRVSKILTRDNVVIIVPNSRFTGEKIINWTHNEELTRFYVAVGVAYGSDVRLVENILLAAADGHDQIVKGPKPFVRFNDFGESSLDFQLYFWTANDFLVENIKSDLRFIIDEEFRKNQIQIPFPQRDLHLKSKDFD